MLSAMLTGILGNIEHFNYPGHDLLQLSAQNAGECAERCADAKVKAKLFTYRADDQLCWCKGAGASDHKVFDEALESGVASRSYDDRPYIFLLGDSRGRHVFEHMRHLCTNVDQAFHWAAPGRFTPACGGSSDCKPRHHNVAAGSRCNDSSEAGALAFFAHYGVSSDGQYYSDIATHEHFGWRGPGWAEDAHGYHADSPALVVEAATRFIRSSPFNASCVVFSSMLWDIARHKQLHRNQPLDEWRKEYEANISSVVGRLQNAIHTARRGGALLLVKEYPVIPHHAFRNSSRPVWEGSPWDDKLVSMVNSVVLHLARRANLRIVDLAAAMGSLDGQTGYTDWIHPSAAGAAAIWPRVVSACREGLK